jgi:hypothetical protein
VELKMSNELSVILQANPSLMGLDEDTLAVAGGSVATSNSNKRISIAGGVFRKMANGKEVGAIEDRHMNVIFVKMAHTPCRTLYDSSYTPGKKAKIICWASDARTPDADVKNKTNITMPTVIKTAEAYNQSMKNRQKLENKLFRVVIALGGKVIHP